MFENALLQRCRAYGAAKLSDPARGTPRWQPRRDGRVSEGAGLGGMVAWLIIKCDRRSSSFRLPSSRQRLLNHPSDNLRRDKNLPRQFGCGKPRVGAVSQYGDCLLTAGLRTLKRNGAVLRTRPETPSVSCALNRDAAITVGLFGVTHAECVMLPNQPSSATRPAGRLDGNRDAMAG